MEVVVDRGESERIEITITSNDDPGDGLDGRDWAEGASASPVGDRRVLTVATITAVVALLLGWFIGYSARSDEAAPAAATTTEATERSETTVVESLPGEPVPLPATTRPPRTTTTTTLAPPVVETVELDPRLTGIELTLTGVESNGANLDLLELDLADSTLTHTDIGRSYNIDWMLAGDDWALIVGGEGTARLVRDGEPPEISRQGEMWEVRWQVDTGRYWRPDVDGEWFASGPPLWVEYDITGEPTGATLEIPYGGWAQFVDPRGGLVMETTGKHYAIDSSGATLLGSGHLLGLSSDIAVFWNCDEQLRCGAEVVDRHTGAVRKLASDLSSDGVAQIDGLWGWGDMASTTVSPDGAACAVMLIGESRAVMGLLDLESGAIVELGETWWMPAITWSPDARFAFYLEGDNGAPSHLSAYDRDADEAFSVFVEPRHWRALSARPATTDG